jgi:hypothetical protein
MPFGLEGNLCKGTTVCAINRIDAFQTVTGSYETGQQSAIGASFGYAQQPSLTKKFLFSDREDKDSATFPALEVHIVFHKMAPLSLVGAVLEYHRMSTISEQ